MTSIRLELLSRHFGSTKAVDEVQLSIEPGELFFLLGPSGCGKTTLLRMIAGFLEPTAGRITFDDRDVTALPANRRNTGMVFQSYALWPHMTVADNVAYGLQVRKVKARERSERVAEALRTVQMEPYAKRRPNELSGGQQQRVALARALVIKPTVLLLDEPLSNLDAKLRLEMRTEIRRICRATGITTVYVTHDQKEALSMADRVAVLRDGRVAQVGPPRQLYVRPATRFVADFLGETNFLTGTITASDADATTFETLGGTLHSTTAQKVHRGGQRVTCSIRPESLRITPATDGAPNLLTGRRLESIYLGEAAQHRIELADKTVVRVLELNPEPFGKPGDLVRLTVDPRDVVILTDA